MLRQSRGIQSILTSLRLVLEGSILPYARADMVKGVFVAVASYDFGRRRPGKIHCFSLKNPSYPEYSYKTESGVMCLDFHKQPHSSLLAVGCYDGTVMVFDIKLKSKEVCWLCLPWPSEAQCL